MESRKGHNKFRKIGSTVLAAGTGIALLLSCGQAAAAVDELKVVLQQPPTHPDPIKGRTHSDYIVATALFSTLMRISPETGDVEPKLVNRYWYNRDRGGYYFELKEDLRWSDGSPITSADVVFTIRRAAQLMAAESSGARGIFDFITGFPEAAQGNLDISDIQVSAVTDRVVWLATESEDDTIRQKLVDFQSSILPKHRAAALSANWDIADLVFSGPCIANEYIPDKQLTCSKNPHYVGADNVAFNRVWFYLAGQSRSAIRIKTMEAADLVLKPNPDTLSQATVLFPEWLDIPPGDQDNVYLLNLNLDKAEFKDRNIRKAIMLSIDVDRLIDKNTMSRIKAQSLLPGTTVSLPDEFLLPIKERRSVAKRLLAEAGYGPDNPLQVTFGANDVQGSHTYVRYLIADLHHTGINVVTRFHDTTDKFRADFKQGNIDICVSAWGAAPGTDDSYYLLAVQDKSYGYLNFRNHPLNARIRTALLQPDKEIREEMSRNILSDVVTEYHAFPLMSRASPVIRSPALNTAGNPSFWFWSFHSSKPSSDRLNTTNSTDY